jgi:hypothetical protein
VIFDFFCDEVRRILGLKSDTALAKKIDMPQSTVAAWRKKKDKIGPLIDALISSGHRVEIRLNDEIIFSPPPSPPTYHDLIAEIEAISLRDFSHIKGLPGVLNAYLHVFERLDELGQIASKDDLLGVWQSKPSWWRLEPVEASASDRKKALELLEQVAPEAVADALANRTEFVRALKEIRARRKRLFG